MSMMLAAGSGCGNQAAPASSQGSGGSVSAADNAAEAGADAPVRIAVAAPMTGDNAEYGIGFYNAATLMAENGTQRAVSWAVRSRLYSMMTKIPLKKPHRLRKRL